MKTLILPFIFLSIIVTGCTSVPKAPSDLTSIEGLVFGMMENLDTKFYEVENPNCALMYKRSFMQGFSKSVTIKSGEIFYFPKKYGDHVLEGITCNVHGDIYTIKTEIPYSVNPGSLNYIGRFTVKSNLPSTSKNAWKEIGAALIGAQATLDGRVSIQITDHHKEDVQRFRTNHPEFKNMESRVAIKMKGNAQ